MFIMIMLMLAAFLIPQLAGGLVDFFITLYVPSYTMGLSIAIFAAIYLLRYTKKYKQNIIKISKENAKKALLFMLPSLVSILVTIIQLIAGIRTFGGITYSIFALSLMAGISEETAFRAIPVSYIMKERPAAKTIPLSLAVTSVLFGAVHMTNMIAGVTLPTALFQSFAATCFGVLFAAVFLRTKSILPAITVHFLNDFVGLMDAGSTADGLMINPTLTGLDYIDLGFALVYLIVGIYLIRPSKHEEILKLWGEEETKKNEEQEA